MPEDFEDTALRRHLDRHPPEIVLAGDLAEWLPGPDRPSQETALALRGILDSGASLVLLRGEVLVERATVHLGHVEVAQDHVDLVVGARNGGGFDFDVLEIGQALHADFRAVDRRL